MSRRAVNRRSLGEALMWAVKADNHGLASSISELVLREMAKDEKYSVADVLSDLSSCIACSESLAFLGTFSFHEMFKLLLNIFCENSSEIQ
jgi:hypothetical protein